MQLLSRFLSATTGLSGVRPLARFSGLLSSLLWLIVSLAGIMPSHAADAQDVANPTVQTSWGLNGSVYAMAVQSDGKVIVGGEFTSYHDGRTAISRNNIARLNPDGSLDSSFAPGLAANDPVVAIAIQGDGKIMIGGGFTAYNGITRNRIARIHSDGTLDSSFNPGEGAAGGEVLALALQNDGKVVIGGKFTYVNGVPRNRVARLNSDGTLDTSFGIGNVRYGAAGYVISLAIQNDGKILVCGNFTVFDRINRKYIARLHNNGTLDTSFDSRNGPSSEVNVIRSQNDGKVLIGGFFTEYNGARRDRLARLNSNGTLDNSFNTGFGTDLELYSLEVQDDGKVLIGGNFTTYNGVGRHRIARINTDGSLDTSFTTNPGTNGLVRAIATQGPNLVLIGGAFTRYDETRRDFVARLKSSGALDNKFAPGHAIGGPADETE